MAQAVGLCTLRSLASEHMRQLYSHRVGKVKGV